MMSPRELAAAIAYSAGVQRNTAPKVWINDTNGIESTPQSDSMRLGVELTNALIANIANNAAAGLVDLVDAESIADRFEEVLRNSASGLDHSHPMIDETIAGLVRKLLEVL